MHWILPVMLLAACPDALAQSPPDPTAILLNKHLKAVGSIWLNEHERALRGRFDELDKLESRRYEAQGKVNWFIQQNEPARAQLDAANSALEKLRVLAAAAAPGSALRRQRDEDARRQQAAVDKLRPLVIPPTEFGETARVKAAVIELIAARDELALAIIDIRSLMAGLEKSYQALEQSAEVRAALERLGPRHQLGPGKNYRSEMKRLAKLEPLVFTADVPLYRESGQFRISAILNESVPAVFSWRETSEPAVIPASLAQALGIETEPEAQRISQRTADGRELVLQAAKIPQLRVGKFVVDNVEVFIMPPEGEDLGAHLGAMPLRDLSAKLEPHLLRLTLKK